MRFRLAEEANIYSPKAAYSNWKDFETDIAQLCQLVMLFSESEGSVSELTTFSDIDEIARKLLVIIDEENYKADSYIRWGVVKALDEKYGRSSVYVLKYDGLNIAHKGPIGGIELVEFRNRLGRVVPTALEKHKDPRSFDPSRSGHIIKLITGFIQHFGALTLIEISVILSALDMPHEDKRILQFLECAIFLEWIVEDQAGQSTLYVSARSRDAIQYRLAAGSPVISKSSWRALVRRFWSENDPERFACIGSAAKSMT
jgi:hypothetical protein